MKRIFLMLIVLLLLSGCGASSPQAPETAEPGVSAGVPTEESLPPETILIEEEAAAMAEPPDPAVPVVLECEAPGLLEQRSATAVVDYSNGADGYVMVAFLGQCDTRLKVRITGPATTYTYNLPVSGWQVFPLSDGDGSYQVAIYRNVTGSQYATEMTARFEVELHDEFVPFLRPNQYVNYADAPETMAMGQSLCTGITDPLEKVAAVYDYVVENFEYDYDRAATVKSGYLPELDLVLKEKKGICFDYAAVMTAMLRSQQVPCKLVVGYVGSAYHAWINVWTEEEGWVNGAIFFNGSVWKRMDPTFASSGKQSDEIMNFIESGSYTAKYLY